jgi:hypothetical protein
MTWSDHLHEHLDGRAAPPADLGERRLADMFRQVTRGRHVVIPGEEVDRAVMAVVRDRRRRRLAWVPRMAVAAALVIAGALGMSMLSGMLEPTPVPLADATTAGPPVAPALLASAPVPLPPPVTAPQVGVIPVQFRFDAPEARHVALVGSFNDWDPDALPLRRDAATGQWAAVVPLPPGEYAYMLVVDRERWVPDPRAAVQVPDSLGRTLSLRVVSRPGG